MSCWIPNHSYWCGTRALHLAWPFFEVVLLTTWHAQSLFRMSLRSTMSSVLGWHYISLQTPGDFQSIFLVFLITYLRRISKYFLPKLITKCMVVTQRSTATASRCCWRPPRFKLQIAREKHDLPIVFDSFVSSKAKKTLASTMHSGLCHTRLNALNFFQENTLQYHQICAPLGFTGLKHYLHFCGPCVGTT